MNPYEVVRMFEAAAAKYTGAPYAVAVNSCTNALFLCLAWHQWSNRLPEVIEIPKLTYVGVPMQIRYVGAKVKFREELWTGVYQLAPLPIWDSACRFRAAMYDSGHFVCTSHHWNKPLGIQAGGLILHDDIKADRWFRRARFDGRTEGVPPAKDKFDQPGWHMMMSPENAAAGLARLSFLPRDNPDKPRDPGYPDLSTAPIFR